MKQLVIVELDAERSVRRVGTVTGTKGVTVDVTWPDGAQESIKVGLTAPDGGTYIKTFASSWQFEVLTRRAELEAELSSDPVEVFLLILRGQERARTARDLRDTLQMGQFDPATVRSAWERTKRAIEARGDVVVRGDGAKRTYQWNGSRDVPEPPPVSAPAGPAPSSTADVPAGKEEWKQEQAAPTEASAADVDATEEPAPPEPVNPPVSTAVDANAEPAPAVDVLKHLRLLVRGEAPQVEPSAVLDAARRHPAAVRALVDVLTDQAGSRSAVDACRDVLESGLALAEVGEDVLEAAWPRLEAPGNAFLFGIARRSKTIDAADPIDVLGVPAVAGLVGRAIDEATANRRTDAKSLHRAFGWLLERVLRSEQAADLGVEILSRAATSGGTRDDEQSERLVAVIAQALNRAGASGWNQLSTSSRDRIARASASLPLTAKGSRAKLITSISKVAPTALASAQWWQNVGIDDLFDAASGPLGMILSDATVESKIVRPTYESALNNATTRRRVMELLAAPIVIARTVAPSTVAAAIARSASDDVVARAWMSELRDEDGRHELEAAAEEARAQREAAEERARAAVERADRAQARTAELDERLRAAAQATGQLRDSQTRQAQIDAVRGLASLAAFVEKSIGHLDSERVIARVRGLVRRQGLAPLGEIGANVAYEPDKHDLVGPVRDVGAPVVVRSSGYTWNGPEGEIVLVQAVVEHAD